jgi:FKBP-type peptidyl-prolyl cis-trans isomerase FklB
MGCAESAEEAAFRASLIDKALNDDNRKLGEAFLAKTRRRKEVYTTASGLQYLVLASGEGQSPSRLDRVQVHYEGTLVTGEVFDSSYQRSKTSTFPVTKVIQGWREALLKMRVGDHWKIFLPADLAYGSKSPSDKIAANSALVFNIKLLAVIGE